jgi:hypothetical protein
MPLDRGHGGSNIEAMTLGLACDQRIERRFRARQIA